MNGSYGEGMIWLILGVCLGAMTGRAIQGRVLCVACSESQLFLLDWPLYVGGLLVVLVCVYAVRRKSDEND
jgi:hypothetical protein